MCAAARTHHCIERNSPNEGHLVFICNDFLLDCFSKVIEAKDGLDVCLNDLSQLEVEGSEISAYGGAFILRVGPVSKVVSLDRVPLILYM